MERSNQPPEPECCRRQGQVTTPPAGGGAERTVGGVHREIREPQAGVAPRLSNPASKPLAAGGDAFLIAAPNTVGAAMGKAQRACRGLRAWRVKKGPSGTKETQSCPAALTTRAKREGQPNDQKGRLRESRGVGSPHSSAGQGASPDRARRGRQDNAVRTGNQRGRNDRAKLANLPAGHSRQGTTRTGTTGLVTCIGISIKHR